MPSGQGTRLPPSRRPRWRRAREPSALGLFEKLGAWTGVWTPPKGVPVPPVPKRKIFVGLIVAAAILTPAAILIAGAIDTSKEAGARAERRRRAAYEAAERRRLAVDQRPRSARSATRTKGLAPAAARATLVTDLERAVTADARARVRRGALHGPIARTICERGEIGGEEKLASILGRYHCTVVTRENRSVRGFPFVTGYTFVATIHFDRRTFVWCKTNPRPGEQASRAAVAVKLSRSCAGPLRDIF